MTALTTPRGIRNNNPLNIRINDEKFRGEVIPSADKSFKQFTSMAYGYRAAFRMIRTYYNKRGLKTIREIINRWAPPIENHTDIYVNTVSKYAGYPADEIIDLNDEPLFKKIIAGMHIQENGVKFPPNKEFIDEGYRLYKTE